MNTSSRFFPRFVALPVVAVLFALIVALAGGCGNKETTSAGTGLEAQQKGVMGGTPPPGEMAKIDAERAKQAQTQATEQAKAQAEAAAKGGK